MKRRTIVPAAALVLLLLAVAWGEKKSAPPVQLTDAEREQMLIEVGRRIFFDEALSAPKKMSCATCHAPEAGFTSPDGELNEDFGIYHGSIEKRFGNRKIPTSAYLLDVPPLHYDERGFWVGGLFYDGRATGWEIDPLVEQAMGPFLNPVEHNMPGPRQVVLRVAQSDYAHLFRQVWGPNSLDHVRDVYGSYERIAKSLAAYQLSDEVNPFTSKYDFAEAGEATLTEQELIGKDLFFGKAMCVTCHAPPLFTDFSYANVGMPKNPQNPFYQQNRRINPDGYNWVDLGLGEFLQSTGLFDETPEVYIAQYGAHKTPTLRNVDRRPDPDFVKAYGHNGGFKSLEEIVHFYNTRDIPGKWPAPEVDAGNIVGMPLLGDLKLTQEEEEALVAFLRTLTDGYEPED